jgi:hypothetical protein
MLLRSQFINGFSRVFGLVNLLALFLWAVLVVLGAVSIYHSRAQDFWPYTRIFSDAATWLLVFVCLGAPLLSFLFSLPINAVKFILAGFLKLDDEGVPQGDWLLFKLFGFLLTGVIPYLSQLFAWAIVLATLYFVDTERSTDSVLTFFVWKFNLDDSDTLYLQIFAHAFELISAIAVRFALWLGVGFHVQSWLENFFEKKILGEARTKVVLKYVDTIAEHQGFFPAIRKLLMPTRGH